MDIKVHIYVCRQNIHKNTMRRIVSWAKNHPELGFNNSHTPPLLYSAGPYHIAAIWSIQHCILCIVVTLTSVPISVAFFLFFFLFLLLSHVQIAIAAGKSSSSNNNKYLVPSNIFTVINSYKSYLAFRCSLFLYRRYHHVAAVHGRILVLSVR